MIIITFCLFPSWSTTRPACFYYIGFPSATASIPLRVDTWFWMLELTTPQKRLWPLARNHYRVSLLVIFSLSWLSPVQYVYMAAFIQLQV
ncbi:hypothetical protein BU23DRAFT_168526 [Bimuria novae-zelandiae CBS 107.79]|uniref:Uncharacterized protein n=1 Tax=Bimuria novae-zelandiae CBS 107.79 TaxID=1447943 RepID=A0A6A5V526_9PLEO|nr:hypothetical protein BU23DRAFT_168526 [Bimuria novae-zelandiae CBS 107.79]